MLCSIFWCSLTLLCSLAQGFCKSVCGQVVPCLVCNVSLPLCHFCWLLEAAQGCGIFHGERRVQELPVLPAHGLHRRGESPLAQRSGPLTGHRARRGVSQMFNSSSCVRPFICRIQFSDTFSLMLRLCPRKKKCWSGRGSMRTAGRRWWRWGKWDLGWHYITARIQSTDLTPHSFFFEGDVVTKRSAFRLRLLSLFIIASGFLTLNLPPIALGNCYCSGLCWSNAALHKFREA